MRPRRRSGSSFEAPRRPEPQTRINDAIRVPRVRLIGENGEQLGIKATDEARDSDAPTLVAALAELSPEHRAVIVLRHLLDYSPGEIGTPV